MANPTNSRQIADQAILDVFGKQSYLGNAYVITTGPVEIADSNAETPLCWITNPASNSAASSTSSSPTQNNVALFQSVRKLSQATNVSSATTLFRFYGQPTISANGTALNINSLRPGMGFSSKMKAYVSPSVSANGTLIAVFAINYQEVDSSVLFILDPGYSLLVTAETDTDSTDVICELSHWEL